VGPAGGPAGPEVEHGIADARRDGGRPLDGVVRRPMEQVMGADLSHIRVHTDDRAHAMNQALGARAFTLGSDVFFRAGEFRPDTDAGLRTLAHESAHVLQQDPSRVRRQDDPPPTGAPVVVAPAAGAAPPATAPAAPAPPAMAPPAMAPPAMAQPALAQPALGPPSSVPPALVPGSGPPGAPPPFALKGVAPGRRAGPPGSALAAAGPGVATVPRVGAPFSEEFVRGVEFQNCSWATLAAVLGREQQALVGRWATRFGVAADQVGPHLRTELAWIRAMVGLDVLKEGAANGPSTFQNALTTIDARVAEAVTVKYRALHGGVEPTSEQLKAALGHAAGVAQWGGLQQMVVDSLAQASAPAAAGSSAAGAGRGAERAFVLGDAGHNRFVSAAIALAAMTAFPVATRFVVFLRGRKGSDLADAGHYVAASRDASGVTFTDHQQAQGTSAPRGLMPLERGWPTVHADFRESYDVWAEAAFIAKTSGGPSTPVAGLEEIDAAKSDSYMRGAAGPAAGGAAAGAAGGAGGDELAVASLAPPPWLATVVVGTELYDTRSRDSEARCVVAESQGAGHAEPKAAVNPEMEAARAKVMRPGATVGTKITSRNKGKFLFFVGGEWKLGVRRYQSVTGADGVKTSVLSDTVQQVSVSQLSHATDAPKLASKPPVWLDGFVDELAQGVGAALRAEAGPIAEHEGSVAYPKSGGATHVFDDRVVIAVAGGLRAMLRTLGIEKEAVVPIVGKTLLIEHDLAKASYLQCLGTPIETYERRGLGTMGKAAALDVSQLRNEAVAHQRAQKPGDTTGKSDEQVSAMIIAENGPNPAFARGGMVLLNANASSLDQIARSSDQVHQAVVHLLIHEFVHANSAGGGGAAFASEVLDNEYEEAVTEILARSVSLAINQARGELGGAVGDAVRAAVPEIRFLTFSTCGCMRYQSNVNMIVDRIVDPTVLRRVASVYLGSGKAHTGDIAGTLKR
jgi:hypothetical protein